MGLFSSQYRQSYRQIQNIMQAVFGIEMSLGTINNLRMEVSESVSAAVTAAQEYMTSLNLQERNILDFLVESVSAARASKIPPSLLP